MNILTKPNVWFTSDYHIYHENILKLGKGRPFSCVEEMHAVIADRHNAVVRPGDKVYNFGDFALKCTWEQAYAFRQRLLGQQHFLFGNHDHVADEMIKNNPGCFVWAKGDPDSGGMHHLKLKGYDVPKITICHYAMQTWPGSYGGAWQLYGHSHGMLADSILLRFDCGVDCWDFTPVSIEQVAQKMKPKVAAWEAWKATLPEGIVE
jgi:calcineurin-like phosphoesterase family protein